MTPDQMKYYLEINGPKLLEEIKANRAKIDSCKRHLFDIGAPPYAMGAKYVCQNCGGSMEVLHIFRYAQGYKAAGGNPNEVVPGYE